MIQNKKGSSLRTKDSEVTLNKKEIGASEVHWLPIVKVPPVPLLFCHPGAATWLVGSDNCCNCITSASSPGPTPPPNGHPCLCMANDVTRSHHSPEQIKNSLREEIITKNYRIHKEGKVHERGATNNLPQGNSSQNDQGTALKCID